MAQMTELQLTMSLAMGGNGTDATKANAVSALMDLVREGIRDREG